VDDQTIAQPPDIGFEKMRAMLGRASELRADEQRQVVELLDEVRARLTPVEDFVSETQGRLAFTHETMVAIQQRLGALPDRTEVSVIAERIDEALSRIDAQDEVLRQVSAAVAALSDRVGQPLDALDARLEGVAGRFEGVSGRLDGLDDRLQHLHARLDELDGGVARVQGAVDALPGSLDIPALHRRFDEVHGRFDGLNGRFEGLNGHVDESVRSNVGTLAGSLERGIEKLQDALQGRPDRDELARALRLAQLESERRMTEQLDSVLADFAEVVISQNAKQEIAATPRPAARKAPKKSGD
jgi:tetrahydromethanopterin S-methyltransferase subunit G